MTFLINLFASVHEGLHVLALRLIGRPAADVQRMPFVIPDDLTAGQFIFVAGLPALVFWLAVLLCLRQWLNAADTGGFLVWMLVTLFWTLAALATLRDLRLIVQRLRGGSRP